MKLVSYLKDGHDQLAVMVDGYVYEMEKLHPEVIRDFAVNKGKRNGPASQLRKGGLERPVSVKFDPSGRALYIVDFGIMKMTKEGPQPQKNTGMIWKITKK